MISGPPAPEVSAGFSSPKKGILLLLKRAPDRSVAELAEALGVSRAAAWKHLAKLEGSGWVERRERSGRTGRPAALFRLTPASQRLFPEAYTRTALAALGFIERRMGREAVLRMLEERAAEIRGRHAPRLAGRALGARVGELARIRDEEGYMADATRSGPQRFALVEHNCPILAIAERYGEACDVERRLFRDLLRADVEVRHRVVAGDAVCRFLVRPNGATSGP